MTLEETLHYFQTNYPDAKLVKIPEDNPLEIICEIEPTQNHPNYSIALAAISISQPHKHFHSTEEYEVIHGAILLKVDEKIQTLYEHEKETILPGRVHSASSVEDFALVKVTSQPGWTQADHILI